MQARQERRGFTLLEVLFIGVMLSALLGAAYVFITSGAAQRKQVEGYLDLQRDVRLAVRRLEKDLRGLLVMDEVDLRPGNQLARVQFQVPVDDDLAGPVRYEYDAGSKSLSRNGELLLENSVADFQLWVFDAEGKELKDKEALLNLHRVRIRLEVEALDGTKSSENRRRVVDLALVPRIPVSRYKGQLGRLNLENSRFLQAHDRPTNVFEDGSRGEE